MQLRRATIDDADGIHALLLRAFTPFRRQYTDGAFDATVLDPARIRSRLEEGPVWVIADSRTVRGTVSCMMDNRGCYIRGLAVDPDAQRLGLGRQLLDACHAHAKVEGAACMWLSTSLFLAASISLYQGYGFHDAPGPADLHGMPLRSFEMAVQPDS